jgi:pimeloyl-ACP methyl ester carboxylesterase
MSLRPLFALGASMILAACSSAPTPPSSPSANGGAPPSSAPAAPCPAGGSVDFRASNARGALDGTLDVPTGCGPFPVVLVIPGSGPTDRDGNSTAGISPASYKLLAEGLATSGIASLRYDKAGIGASVSAAPPSESMMVFEMGADDAAILVTALRADKRFSKVIVLGHSEGSLLGMLAAERTPIDGFVSVAGAGRPIAAILRDQLAASITDPSLLATADSILDALAQGQTVANVPASLQSLFRPSVQPYIISWMKYDPAQEITKVKAPVLIVQGTTDIQVSVQDAKLLAAARPDATLDLIDGMNHVMKAATLDTASQNAAYTDPTLPLVPAFLTDVEGFVARD